jgi:4-hydroxyphenylacetate 3-monooxygenase
MDEIAARAAEAEQASHYASVRFQPEYAREQDQKKGYYIEDEKASNLVSTAPTAAH